LTTVRRPLIEAFLVIGRLQAPVVIYEANGSAYDLSYLAERFQEEFNSVEHAATALPSDREQIIHR
jgi:hypothetical protein